MRNNGTRAGRSFPIVLCIIFFVGAGILGHPSEVFAQGGPPMITDDPGTPGAGHWENNFAVSLDNTTPENLYETPIADINYGWGSNVQLKLELPWAVVKTPDAAVTTGIANAELGVKVRFMDEDSSGFNFSTYPQYRLNYTGISSILFGNQFYLPIETSRTFDNLVIAEELGYDFIIKQHGIWKFGIVAGYNTSDSFEILAELHAGSDPPGIPKELFANAGCRYKITDALFFLGSVGDNVAPGYLEYLAFAGVQVLVQ
jgi:hypothetical protein